MVCRRAVWEDGAMKPIIRSASVRWTAGKVRRPRTAATERGGLKLDPFSRAFRRQARPDTDSAELMAAALAGSFSLALIQELGRAARLAGEILTSAAITLERRAAGWTIVNILLSVVARLPKATQGGFIDAAVRAKTNGLVSRALRPRISMNARLEKEP